ncbi:MAG: GNAT family N-acetyltransferase [Saprospiraceae bacterium]|nr:GNAT family N-acetyltransferase [Saprospiraceae bacterium]
MIFSTSRLNVRKLRKTDVEPFFRLESDPVVKRYTSPSGDWSYSAIEKDLNRLIKGYTTRSELTVWAVEDGDQKFVGTVALVGRGEEREIGYRILPDYWRQGYGLEICEGLIRYAFDDLKIGKLVAISCSRNKASVSILDRLMYFVKEEYNEDFADMDRYYELGNIKMD